MKANAEAKLVHEFERPSQYKVVHVAVTKIRSKRIGDLNVQIEGTRKLCFSFLPNLYWLLRNEFAETTYLIYSGFIFFLGVQQRDFDGVNVTK